MSNVHTIETRDVKVGDEIFNSAAVVGAARWVRVTAIELHEDGAMTLTTPVFSTRRHPRAGIAVRRGPEAEKDPTVLEFRSKQR